MKSTLGKVQQVAADKEARLVLKLGAGHQDGDPVTMTIHKAEDDEQLDSIDATIERGKAVALWTAKGPDPTGDARSWRVYYKVSLGDDESISPELEVYLDKLELTTQDEEGNALADVGFSVTVGKDGKPKKGNTGSTGTLELTNLPPGEPVQVRWQAPARLVEWVEDGAGKKVAKLKKSFKARLLFPPSGEHTQWINFAADPKHPDRGSKLKVRVGVVPEDGPSLAGDEYFLKAEWAAEEELSARNDPKRALVGGKAEDWSGDGVGRVVKLAKDGAEAVFELQLGMAGGDEVTLSVGGTDACEDDKVVVKNLRKLFYQITHRKTLGAPVDMSSMTASLDEVGVEYERYGLETYEEGQKGLPKGTFFDGAEVGLPGVRLSAIGDHNKKFFHEKLFKDTKKPLGVHVLMADLQVDGGTPSALVETHEPELDSDSVEVDCARIPFKTALQDGKSALVAASWQSLAPKGHADYKKKGTLGAANFEFRPLAQQVVVKLSPPASELVGDGSGAKHPVKVRFKIKVVAGFYNGEADWKYGNWQIIATKQPNDARDALEDRPAERACQTLTHELGHTMSQVVTPTGAPPGLDHADHGRQYSGHGHSGSHCADGMSQGDFDGLESFQGRSDCTCVMYGEGADARTIHFCDRCKPFVRAARLTTL